MLNSSAHALTTQGRKRRWLDGQSSLSRAIWIVVLLVVTGAHGRLLSGADFYSDATGSPYYGYFRWVVGFVCLCVVFARAGESLRLAVRAKFIAPFLLLATVGLLGAADARFSALSLAGLVTTLAAAFAVAGSMPPDRLARLVVHLMGVTVVLCVVSVAFLPHYAIVQAGEPPGSGAPGEWRGMYGSKNALGHVAGIYTGALLFCGRVYFKRYVLWLLAVSCGVACVLLSRSTSAIIIVAIQSAIAVWVGKRGVIRISLRELVFIVLAALGALFADEISASIFSLVGKDATFSGRDVIWEYALELISGDPWTGAGYGYTNSAEFIQALQTAVDSFAAVHFHNSFLDVAYNVGIPASLLFFAWFIWAPFRAIRVQLDPSVAVARGLFVTTLGGWFLSCFTEIDAVRPVGAVALIGVLSAVALYAVPTRKALKRTVPMGVEP